MIVLSTAIHIYKRIYKYDKGSMESSKVLIIVSILLLLISGLYLDNWIK